jgi:Domain of unknown function (DUF4173)
MPSMNEGVVMNGVGNGAVLIDESKAGPEIQPLQFASLLHACVAVAAAFMAMLIFEHPPGSIVALVYALPMGVLAWQQHQNGWTRNPALLFALAAMAVLAIFIEPSLVNMLTGFCFVAAAASAKRGADADDGLRIARQLFFDAVKAPFRIVSDALSSLPQLFGVKRSNIIAAVLVPVAAAGVFGFMLLSANPLLERIVVDFIDHSFANLFTWRLIIVFPLTLALCWMVLRDGEALRDLAHGPADARRHEKFFRPASVIATLVLLNGFFLVENLLDLNHVWLDGKLPAGLSHAQYVHRGAYTLIATVIMAAGFIMLALRPGSATNGSLLARALVYLFAAQNLALVASSMKRTFSYIDDFGMTEWRLSGLIWMGLVAIGLGLTVQRILQNRDNHWLINANIQVAALLMLFCAFADFRPFIANWNVDKAIAAGNGGALDVRYNKELGLAALPALQRFTAHKFVNAPWSASNIVAANNACHEIRGEVRRTQYYWQSWTLRHALSDQLDVSPVDGCITGGPVK